MVIRTERQYGREPRTVFFDVFTPSGLLFPVPQGLSFIFHLPGIDQEMPPEAHLVAAAWEDGSTYGPDDLLQELVAGRAATADAYSQGASLLEEGLKKNWTASQFMSAANELQSAAPAPPVNTNTQGRSAIVAVCRAITSTFQQSSADAQGRLEHMAKSLIQDFNHKRESLSLAAPLIPAP